MVEKLRIMHDPGHGGNNTGIVHGGLIEKEWLLSFVQDVHAQLSHWRIDQFLTRENDAQISLEDRGQMGKTWRADLAIIYHVNGAFDEHEEPNTDMHGLMSFVLPEDWVGKEVGSAIMRAAPMNLRRATTKPTKSMRNHWTGRAYNVLSRHHCPAVLVELGFATNPVDLGVLKSFSSRPALVTAIQAGVARFIEIKRALEEYDAS